MSLKKAFEIYSGIKFNTRCRFGGIVGLSNNDILIGVRILYTNDYGKVISNDIVPLPLGEEALDIILEEERYLRDPIPLLEQMYEEYIKFRSLKKEGKI